MDFAPSIHVTQLGEAILPNVFLKQFLIHQRICFTSTVTAEADTAAATIVPNATYTCRNETIH
jgi:hypothetical protein